MKNSTKLEKSIIGVIGLGYVGMPLAVEFGKKYRTIGYDISSVRIDELSKATDRTGEVKENVLEELLFEDVSKLLNKKNGFLPTNDHSDLLSCNIFIVTVPTPIDASKRPDLTPLISASSLLGSIIKKNDIIIYESTTYPGCTEEDCVPILEKNSGLKFNIDFFVGYSPERINPGDKVNTLVNIKKVTSGSTPETANFVDELYKSIIIAGTYKAESIKVAEASKAIENAQRDINISFVNELALIFDKLGINTTQVLNAAATKWNFLKYKPGLVGGHCIGVDPYYLAYKAEQSGYHPAVILSGRRVNDGMGAFVANKLTKLMISKGILIKDAKVLILGITFKENCPDIRNTRIIDIRNELLDFGCDVEIIDPHANEEEVEKEFGFKITTNIDKIEFQKYSGIILGVAHDEFLNLEIIKQSNQVIFDVKGILGKDIVDAFL